MNSDRLEIDAAGNGCPSRDVIVEFLQGVLASHREAWIAQHIEQCAGCLAAVEALTSRERWERELRAFDDVCQRPTALLGSGNGAGTTTVGTAPSTFRTPAGPSRDVASAMASFADRFHHLESIGRGGCANVYRAEDTALGRIVALKIPHAAFLSDPQAQPRFITELRATAALHHPNIVALYDAGTDDEKGYIVFEYVAGPTLAAWLTTHTHPVDGRTAAAIVACLADGVQHAHEAGILHRDLKPSNVLLDETRPSGELPFVPRIADFGIARFLNSDVTHTLADVVLGSPPFMSPEQALGDRDRIGPASDVYALGGILYQLLTLQLPIKGASAADTLRRVLTDDPRPPRRFHADLPRDLEAICLKCLSKNPNERYASARALDLDLKRFLAGESVTVRPPGVLESALRVARRHPAWTLLAGTVVAAILMVLVLLSQHSSALGELAEQLKQTNAQLTTANVDLGHAVSDARAARDNARDNERRARDTVYAYDMRRAFEAWESHDARMVWSLLKRYADGSELADYRGVAWQYLWLRTQHVHREILRAPQAVYMVRLSPDGRLLAAVGQDAQVRLMDWPSGTPAGEWTTEQGEVNGVCFSPNGQLLWTAGDDGTICLWDRETHKCRYRIDAHAPNLAYEIVHDVPRRRIISCGREATIRIWDADTGSACGVLEGHRGTIDTIHLHPETAKLYSQSTDRTIKVWNLHSLSIDDLIGAFPGAATYLALSPDGRWLAALTQEHGLIVFDRLSRDESVQFPIQNEPKHLCFDDSSRRLFLGDGVGVIEEWITHVTEPGEIAWRQSGRIWQAHDDEIYHLAWSPQTRELVSAGRDGKILAWSDAPGTRLQYDLPLKGIRDFALIPRTTEVLLCRPGELVLEDYDAISAIEERSTSRRVVDESRPWNRVSASADGRILAAGSEDGRVRIWRIDDNRPPLERQVFEDRAVNELSFTPDGRHLCAATHSGIQCQLIDTGTGRAEPLPQRTPCAQLVFAPRGNIFATSFHRTLQVVDETTGKTLRELPGPSIGKLMFLPDGRTLAVADERKVRIHDARSGDVLGELLGHKCLIDGFAVSRDGRTLATASHEEGAVKLWHISTGQHLADLPVGRSYCPRCAFSDNDQWMAYAPDNDRVRIVRLR